LGAYVQLKRGEGIGACKTRPTQFCSLQQGRRKGLGQYSEELDDMNDAVSNNPAHRRYELDVDGHIAATYYKTADGVITFIHTEVPPELGGKGIGSRLIKGALDQVRADGLKVIAECPFVKAYLEKHPEYADLLKS
jgi:predicted GNAT family acetyltransferase